MLKHNKCGGPVILSLANSIKIVSPGFSISTRGISPGVMEIQSISKSPGFVCLKCGHVFDPDLTDLLGFCITCSDYYPVQQIAVTDFLSSVCTDCFEEISKPGRSDDDAIQRVKEVITMPRGTKAVSLKDIMTKPINV